MFQLQTDTLFIAQSHVHRALYIIHDAMVFERPQAMQEIQSLLRSRYNEGETSQRVVINCRRIIQSMSMWL